MKQEKQKDEFLQKREQRQQKIRKRRMKIYFLCMFVLVLILFVILSLTVFFKIDTIKVNGNKIYSENEIISACGIQKGDNIFTVSKSDALDNLKAKLPYIETVEFKRDITGILKISVGETKDYLCYKKGSKYYTVSKNGWVLNSYKKQPKNVIFITCPKVKCKVGTEVKFTDEHYKELQDKIISLMKENDISLDSFDISSTVSVSAKVEGRFVVDFGSEKDLEPKIKHLKSTIQKIDKNVTGKIDLSIWNNQNRQSGFVQTDIK